MDYFERVQKTIDYIESNLKEVITLDDLAKVSYFSKFHFHRIFQSVVGDSVMDYIRKRRLSEAAFDLQGTKLRITDIAYDYLFNSADTFSRAFKRQYGISADEYRRNQPQVTLYERKSITSSNYENRIQNNLLNDPTIILGKKYTVIGLGTFVSRDDFFDSIENNLENREVDHTAELFFKGLKYKVKNQVNSDIEICYNYGCSDGYISMVCVEVDSLDCVPDGMVAKTIPKSKYVVFSHDFELTPDHISIKELEDNIFRYVYKDWFPYSNYEPTGFYTIEFYHTDRTADGFTTVEVYIPIKAIRK